MTSVTVKQKQHSLHRNNRKGVLKATIPTYKNANSPNLECYGRVSLLENSKKVFLKSTNLAIKAYRGLPKLWSKEARLLYYYSF